MKKFFVSIFVLAILLSGCQSNTAEIEILRKENEQLKQQIEQISKGIDTTNNIVDNSKFDVRFEDDGTPMIFGNTNHVAEIINIAIVYSPNLDKHLLTIDFHYTNKDIDSANFINDSYCNVIAYQAGIQLDTPGFTSENGIYDTNNSFKNIKNAEIDTQLAFILNDTASDIELELGKYDSLINKKIVIKKD